jgi:hypothetical protein
MINFFAKTISDPAIFWVAIQSIATAIGAVLIFWQLRRLREDKIAHKFDGFKYVVQLLSASEFKENALQFYALLEKGDPFKFQSSLPPHVYSILRTLEIVDYAIKEHYLDESTFFRIEGLRLADLNEKIRVLQEGKDSLSFEDQIRLFPNGMNLLSRSANWRDAYFKHNDK